MPQNETVTGPGLEDYRYGFITEDDTPTFTGSRMLRPDQA
jgi:hypothetical protein